MNQRYILGNNIYFLDKSLGLNKVTVTFNHVTNYFIGNISS